MLALYALLTGIGTGVEDVVIVIDGERICVADWYTPLRSNCYFYIYWRIMIRKFNLITRPSHHAHHVSVLQ